MSTCGRRRGPCRASCSRTASVGCGGVRVYYCSTYTKLFGAKYIKGEKRLCETERFGDTQITKCSEAEVPLAGPGAEAGVAAPGPWP
jgi:hypothetical protein